MFSIPEINFRRSEYKRNASEENASLRSIRGMQLHYYFSQSEDPFQKLLLECIYLKHCRIECEILKYFNNYYLCEKCAMFSSNITC